MRRRTGGQMESVASMAWEQPVSNPEGTRDRRVSFGGHPRDGLLSMRHEHACQVTPFGPCKKRQCGAARRHGVGRLPGSPSCRTRRDSEVHRALRETPTGARW